MLKNLKNLSKNPKTQEISTKYSKILKMLKNLKNLLKNPKTLEISEKIKNIKICLSKYIINPLKLNLKAN